MKVLGPFDQFESSVAYLSAIMALKLASLSLSWDGNASLYVEGELVK